MAMLAAVGIALDEPLVIGARKGSCRIARDVPRLVAHYRTGQLKLDELVPGRYPLSAIDEAIADMRRGTALRTVIVF